MAELDKLRNQCRMSEEEIKRHSRRIVQLEQDNVILTKANIQMHKSADFSGESASIEKRGKIISHLLDTVDQDLFRLVLRKRCSEQRWASRSEGQDTRIFTN